MELLSGVLILSYVITGMYMTCHGSNLPKRLKKERKAKNG